MYFSGHPFEVKKKKGKRRRQFPKEVKAILNLGSADIKMYNNSNPKRPEITIKELNETQKQTKIK